LQSLAVRAGQVPRSFRKDVWDLFDCANHGKMHGALAWLKVCMGMICDLFGEAITISMSHDKIVYSGGLDSVTECWWSLCIPTVQYCEIEPAQQCLKLIRICMLAALSSAIHPAEVRSANVMAILHQ